MRSIFLLRNSTSLPPVTAGDVQISWHDGLFRYFFDHSCVFAPTLLDAQHLKDPTDPLDSYVIATAPLSAFGQHLIFPKFRLWTLATLEPVQSSAPQLLGLFYLRITAILSGAHYVVALRFYGIGASHFTVRSRDRRRYVFTVLVRGK